MNTYLTRIEDRIVETTKEQWLAEQGITPAMISAAWDHLMGYVPGEDDPEPVLARIYNSMKKASIEGEFTEVKS